MGEIIQVRCLQSVWRECRGEHSTSHRVGYTPSKGIKAKKAWPRHGQVTSEYEAPMSWHCASVCELGARGHETPTRYTTV